MGGSDAALFNINIIITQKSLGQKGFFMYYIQLLSRLFSVFLLHHLSCVTTPSTTPFSRENT